MYNIHLVVKAVLTAKICGKDKESLQHTYERNVLENCFNMACIIQYVVQAVLMSEIYGQLLKKEELNNHPATLYYRIFSS